MPVSVDEKDPTLRINRKRPLSTRATALVVGGIAAVSGLAGSKIGYEKGKDSIEKNPAVLNEQVLKQKNREEVEKTDRKAKAIAEIERRLKNNEPLPVYFGLTLYDEAETGSSPNRFFLETPPTNEPTADGQPAFEANNTQPTYVPERVHSTTSLRTHTTAYPATKQPRTMPNPIILRNDDNEEHDTYILTSRWGYEAFTRDDLEITPSFTSDNPDVEMVKNYKQVRGGFQSSDGRVFGAIIEGEPYNWPSPSFRPH